MHVRFFSRLACARKLEWNQTGPVPGPSCPVSPAFLHFTKEQKGKGEGGRTTLSISSVGACFRWAAFSFFANNCAAHMQHKGTKEWNDGNLSSSTPQIYVPLLAFSQFKHWRSWTSSSGKENIVNHTLLFFLRLTHSCQRPCSAVVAWRPTARVRSQSGTNNWVWHSRSPWVLLVGKKILSLCLPQDMTLSSMG